MIVGTSLGILVNILLVLGIHQNRRYKLNDRIQTFIIFLRWFLVHWIVYHSIVIVLLLMTTILIFIIQEYLFKLIGLASLALALVVILLTTKVYNMFVEMTRDERCPPLAGPPPGPGPYFITEDVKQFRSGHEFYPVDPVSRGVAERIQLHSYLPQPEDRDSEASIVSTQKYNFQLHMRW